MRNDLADSMAYMAAAFNAPTYKIQVSPFHPKNKPVIGTFTSRAHPLVEWLAKWFPFDPNTYFENVQIGLTWADPFIVDDAAISYAPYLKQGGGRSYTIICSQEQANELTKGMKK